MQLAPTQNQLFAMLATCTILGTVTALAAIKIVPAIVRVALSALGYSKQEPAEKAEPSTEKKCFKALAYTTVAAVGGAIGFMTFLNAVFPKGRLF